MDAAVREALQQYSAALESLDADQVKKIHPSVDARALKRAFKEMRELKVTDRHIKVLSSDGATARVSCRVTQAFIATSGYETEQHRDARDAPPQAGYGAGSSTGLSGRQGSGLKAQGSGLRLSKILEYVSRWFCLSLEP